jgi:hypothetical protein
VFPLGHDEGGVFDCEEAGGVFGGPDVAEGLAADAACEMSMELRGVSVGTLESEGCMG